VKKVLGVSIFLLLSGFLYATHQVGGLIIFKWLGGYTYQFTIIDYTNTWLTSADRDTIRIHYGDGSGAYSTELLSRQNGLSGEALFGNGDPTPNGVPICNYDFDATPPVVLSGARKINIYEGTAHNFPGPGTYRVWMDDPDRMANINNINGSVNIDYYMYTTLVIQDIAIAQPVNSPVITNPPVCQYGCVGQCYNYNPGAYIPIPPSVGDDSISYSLGKSLTTGGEIAGEYTLPASTTIDPKTGSLSWCATVKGIWNFVILMTTYTRTYVDSVKELVPLDTVELELEVDINTDCYPPIINSEDTCVEAGGTAIIKYTAKNNPAANPPQLLYVSYAGEPFSQTPPATLTDDNPPPPTYTLHPVFNWVTNCGEVRDNPYSAILEATEKELSNSDLSDSVYYSSYGTSNITVVGPAPPHLMATIQGTTVCLHWGPSPCPQATGYNIYRAVGCVNFERDICTTGVPSGSGFKKIATNMGLDDTTYCDDNGGNGLSPGVHYSYVVDAIYPFPDVSQSLASNDTCVEIKFNVPLITNVSVTETDPKQGEIFIRWMRPFADSADLDTNKLARPYKYVLMRASGMNGQKFLRIDSVTSNTFRTTNLDTTFKDTRLDTQDSSYNYKVDFYGNTLFIGPSATASSIYLRLRRGDSLMILNWQSSVPWTDSLYYIYRKDPGGNGYNKIDSALKKTYTDTKLTNGYQYCYYVESVSHYLGARIATLYDSSETICGTPIDTIPPCSPPLTVNVKCALYEDSLVWSNPTRLCHKATKVVSYQVFYSPYENGDMYSIATINNPEDTVYVNANLSSVAGCYAVLAFDSAGRVSPFNTICVDNCPLYSLPNVFTPNGDGKNDFFTPLEPYRYVKSIDMSVYNRWGQLVFHTTDPAINWNGMVDNTGGTCPDGVYFYVCVVNEIRLAGIVPITLKGFIEIIR